eukprot:6185454-Amphidinium_carterae.1
MSDHGGVCRVCVSHTNSALNGHFAQSMFWQSRGGVPSFASCCGLGLGSMEPSHNGKWGRARSDPGVACCHDLVIVVCCFGWSLLASLSAGLLPVETGNAILVRRLPWERTQVRRVKLHAVLGRTDDAGGRLLSSHSERSPSDVETSG